MKQYYFLLFWLLLTLQTSAQNFKGRITDNTGEALYGSSVYIKEMNQGLICNEDGYYQTTLKAGDYEVEYKCLGFKKVERKIHVSDNETLTIDIHLEENPFTLNEVTVSGKEDPAYAIMRKAIEKAPLYANAVKEYNADVYIKGNAELLKVSSLINSMASKEEGVKLSDFKDKLFVQESFNTIHFTAPDKYEQIVKAFSSSIPDNLDAKDALQVMRSSLYNPKFGAYISPVNPKAFSYYKFRYDGFIEENGITINKIKIESKLKDPMLLNGYIYIADDTWHIHSAELEINNYGVDQNYIVTYTELVSGVYLPITYALDSKINVLGIEANVNSYASLKYTDYLINEGVVKELNEKKKPKKREFEIKKDSLYTTVSDTLATKRDSLYWANIRSIPLDTREVSSFIKKDSIQNHLDSVRKEHHDPKFSFMDILTGGKIGSDSSKVVFKYSGLIRGAIVEYNFVDGLWLGQKFNLETKLSKHNRLEISPYVYYALARKRLLGGGDITLSYAPMKLGSIKVSAASVSEDFNPMGIHRFNNSLSSLITGKNYNFFYQKDFINVTNNIDVSNGLKLITTMEVARRSGLSNHTDYTWGKRSKIRENIFSDERFDRTVFGMGINYTPYAYYTIKDGAKEYVKFTSPTFYARYSEAFSAWQTNNARYRKLWGGITQMVKLSEFSTLDYLVEGGGFLGNKDKIHFVDFQHFNTADIDINFKSPFTSYMLLDNYAASTNKYWINTNINYTSRYILLKYLPFLQGKMFTETLHLKNLYTPDMKLYTEAGYSVNLSRALNLGVFTSFNKGKYQDCGVHVLFDLETVKRIF